MNYKRNTCGIGKHTYLDGVLWAIKKAYGLGQWPSLHKEGVLF